MIYNDCTKQCWGTKTTALIKNTITTTHLPQSATTTMKYHNATTPQRKAHRATNTFTFRGFGEKVRGLRVSASKFLLRRPTTEEGEETTFFHQALHKARELNLTQAFQVGAQGGLEVQKKELM